VDVYAHIGEAGLTRILGLGHLEGIAWLRGFGKRFATLLAVSADVRVETLPNGLTVLLREVRVAPVAEVQIWARVGSADERDHERGLAHFHEHMLFKGTERRGVGEIAGAVEGAGGRINAFTSFDVTCYHATVPSDVATLGLDVLADAVRCSTFDPDEVKREVGVVLEEINRSEDEPHHVLSDALFAEAFRVHPYGLPILGTAESVSSFTREKVRAFYERWYRPENLVVVLAGDIDADAMFDQVGTIFGDDVRGSAERGRPAEPAQEGIRTALAARPFERTCVDASWPVVPFQHPDAAPLDLLAFILGEGDSSRLVRRVKEELGIVDRIDASCYTPLDAGLFGATLDCETDQMLGALEQVVRETERVRREPVSEEELEKARRNFLASRAWERESVSGMARKIGSSQLLTGDPSYEDIYLEEIRTATREDLQRVAQEWLAPERLNVAAVLPENEAASVTHDSVVAAIERGVDGMAGRFRAPARVKPEASPQARIHDYQLDNGVRVHILPRRDIPVVAARAVLLGGQLIENEQTAGMTAFLASMWLRGTQSQSAAEFAGRIESLASDVDAFAGRNSCGVTLDCTEDQLAPVLDLFADALLAPAFSLEEIERERRETLASLARREDRLSARVFDLFSRTHYRKHPYRYPVAGTPENVTRFDREDLIAHQQRLVTADNLVVAIVGDVDPDQAAAEISRRFGELPGGGNIDALLAPDEAAPTESREDFEHKDRSQAHLVLGFRGLTIHDPEREVLEVLSQLLAGQGGRLFLELRDRKSLAYTVSAMNIEGVAPGFFAVYMGTSPEKYDEALAGIRDELHRVLDAEPNTSELDRARRYLIGNHAIDQQRSAGRALQIALDARYGLGPDADAAFPERIAAITGEDVLRVARRILDPNRATLAAIRP
jgi:zinc protease